MTTPRHDAYDVLADAWFVERLPVPGPGAVDVLPPTNDELWIAAGKIADLQTKIAVARRLVEERRTTDVAAAVLAEIQPELVARGWAMGAPGVIQPGRTTEAQVAELAALSPQPSKPERMWVSIIDTDDGQVCVEACELPPGLTIEQANAVLREGGMHAVEFYSISIETVEELGRWARGEGEYLIPNAGAPPRKPKMK